MAFMFSRFCCFTVLRLTFLYLFSIFLNSLNCCINANFNTGESSHSFFSWHIVCRCLHHQFLCPLVHLSSSLVPFKNGPEYLTSPLTVQMFISLMRFLLQSFVSRSFLVLPRYLKIFHISFYWCFFFYWSLSESNSPKVSRTLPSI